MGNMIDLESTIKMTDVIDILEEYSELKSFRHIETRKPTHGSCCTCQNCGFDNDECVCLSNEIVDLLIKHQIKPLDISTKGE